VIAISHPHFFTTMVEWSDAFGNVPIYVHQADRGWVCRPHPSVRFWSGETLCLENAMTLIHTPGHFDGYQVLVWEGGQKEEVLFFAGINRRCA
jgi:glyoxylase-like metal-dependent hydrolase (beta-lactamase superfamily II)